MLWNYQHPVQLCGATAENVPSPCVSVCRMDAQGQLCEGACARWMKPSLESRQRCRQARRLACHAERIAARQAVAPTPAPWHHEAHHLYLDFISPYAWLAFNELPRTLMGLSYSVQYRLVFLGALLAPMPCWARPKFHQARLDLSPRAVAGAPTRRGAGCPPCTRSILWAWLRLAVATDPAGFPQPPGLETLFAMSGWAVVMRRTPSARPRSVRSLRPRATWPATRSRRLAQGPRRRGHGAGRVWRAVVRGGRQGLLGLDARPCCASI